MKKAIPQKLFTGLLCILAGSITFAFLSGSTATSAQTTVSEPRVIRIFDNDDLRLTNPAGLAFSASSNAFYVIETGSLAQPLTENSDIVKVAPYAERQGAARLATSIENPANVAFDNYHNRLLILKAAPETLIAVEESEEGVLNPMTLTRYGIRQFALQDPQGVTVDPATGDLYILDSDGPRLVHVIPDPTGSVDNAIITQIDLQPTGLDTAHGLAYNPASGSLFVFDSRAKQLVEITTSGHLLRTHDLAEFSLEGSRSMVFAPTSDVTDNPTRMSLFITNNSTSSQLSTSGMNLTDSVADTDGRSAGQIVEISMVPKPNLVSGIPVDPVTLVNVVQTSGYSPPSPDPSGLAYLSGSNSLMISDGEVNEMPQYFTGKNLFEISLPGNLIDTFTTIDYSNEPTGIAYNPANNFLYTTDDTGDRGVFELNPGSDGIYNTNDDVITYYDTGSATDPEGVAYGQGFLYVSDGANGELFTINLGANGVLNQSDTMTQFDTDVLGIDDPEGVEYDPDNGHLYILSSQDEAIAEIETDGTLIRYLDISPLNSIKPAGLAYAPASNNPSQRNLYIVDRAIDNGPDPNENDGVLFEISYQHLSSGNPTNTPVPTVTNTPLPTATNTPLPTATNTPLPTATNTPLPTATNTPLPTATNTPLPTATNTPLPTATNTPLPTATNTPLPTATNTPLPTATNTPLPTAMNTPLPTVTNTPLPTATNTPLPTVPNTPLPTATNTPLPTATNTPLPTATNTPLPTATNTPLPTATNTPLPTATNTPLPTATNTPDTSGGTFTFTAIADAAVLINRSNNNYGMASTLATDGAPNISSYLRFDAQGVTGNVASVTLRIWAVSGSDTGIDVAHVEDNSWSETGITYNNAPAAGAVMGNSGAIVSGTWVEVDVTGLLSGNGAVSIQISTTDNSRINFSSRETNNAPELVIVSSGGPAPTATNTPIPPTVTTTPTPSATAVPTSSTTPGPSPTPTSTPVPPMPTATATASPTPEPGVGETIYLTSATSGTVGTVTFDNADMLTYDTGSGSWALYFDGSDLGITLNNLDAFFLLEDGTILFSLMRAQSIGSLSAVDDSDIVRFLPTSLGENTDGTFEIYFDGSDVGLNSGGEDVDVIGFTPDGRLLISTVGTYSVGITGGDNDLLVLNDAVLGDETSGTWELYFDGEDVELTDSGEDINGAWVAANGDIYLSTLGTFSVTNVSGDGADIFICAPTALGGTTSCTYSLYWDGSASGFNSTIDGFFIGQ